MGDGHRVHIALAGAPEGIPVVLFHGGPGSACNASMLRPFDLSRFFVVMIDQRGSGKSRPAGRVVRNLAAWLVRDIETIRHHLGITSWYVFGGSWGATLAIAYAGLHPSAVRGLVLRGTFLASGREVRGLLSASRRRAPAAWRDLYSASGADRPAALLPALYRQLRKNGPDAWQAARAYSRLEHALLARADRAMGKRARQSSQRDMARQRTKYLVQTHYLYHDCGFRSISLSSLAARAHAHGIRGVAVHGTRDPVCPVDNLSWLGRYMPGIRPVVVDAGHLAGERAIRMALADALDTLASGSDLQHIPTARMSELS